MLRSAFILLLGLPFCQPDETISGFSSPDVDWKLESLNGKTFDATATLSFPEEGKVTGKAPCNSYFATQTAPYPWFQVENIGATRMTCADLELESEFLTALETMTISEVSGNILILTNEDSGEMVFRAD